LNAGAIVEYCRQNGIQLSQRADKLVVRPAAKLTPDLSIAIRAHKLDLLAALAQEDAQEYIGERVAICAADGLPPAHLRPVFEYVLADDPRTRLIMLGIIGQTLAEATSSLQDRFGAERVVSVRTYRWRTCQGDTA
jgi:hypothetical protein